MTPMQSVNIVREKLIALGFEVSAAQKENANGHDLIAISKAGRGFTIEVKKAVFSSRAWRIKPISKKDSDLIAIVFPNGVHFSSMKDHLVLCCKSGERFMTAVGCIYE